MTNETEVEQLIQDKGLTAPRLTPADIDSVIVGETYTTMPSGKTMICELTLRNGFTVRGEASTVSKANFNVEVGQKVSRENARNKIWELEGYLLQSRLYEDRLLAAENTTPNLNADFVLAPYQKRVVEEFDELNVRLTSLNRFIENRAGPFKYLEHNEQYLLHMQAKQMLSYLVTLSKRIDSWNRTTSQK